MKYAAVAFSVVIGGLIAWLYKTQPLARQRAWIRDQEDRQRGKVSAHWRAQERYSSGQRGDDEAA